MKTLIVKYNAGNVQSVIFALNRLGIEPVWSDDPDEIQSADRVLFPGVGEAESAMAYLRQRRLDQLLCGLTQPVLGICLGLQLLCRHSEENDTDCLSVFPLCVRKFEPLQKVPHMGWNQVEKQQGPLFDGLSNDYAYFVHSYYVELGEQTTARTDYIVPFSSAVCSGNFHGVQFHPEKSAEFGAQILQNFLEL